MHELQHCYVRYQVLLAQLHAEPPAGATTSGSRSGTHAEAAAAAPLLHHLQSAYGGAAGGTGSSGAHTTSLELGHDGGGSCFLAGLVQEVERLRQFVRGSLERLWLQLLDACMQLRALAEEQLQASASALDAVPGARAGHECVCGLAGARIASVPFQLKHVLTVCCRLLLAGRPRRRRQQRRR